MKNERKLDVWESLPYVDDVESFKDSDPLVLREIRKVLMKHGCISRFGVSLLHKHFEISPQERLIEKINKNKKSITLSVEHSSNMEDNVIEAMWKFNGLTGESGVPDFSPVQWASINVVSSEHKITKNDCGILNELQNVLVKYAYIDRFGICLLLRNIPLSSDEQLVEYTDVDKRISTLHVETDVERKGDAIETMWKFSNDIEAITVCIGRCIYNSGHVQRHVKEGR